MIVASVPILLHAITVRAMQLNGLVSSNPARSLGSIVRAPGLVISPRNHGKSAERPDRYLR